jgi:hypothetical protein
MPFVPVGEDDKSVSVKTVVSIAHSGVASNSTDHSSYLT